VADTDHQQEHERRERQYRIDRITARYEAEYRAGRSPRLEDYLRRYPAFSTELIEFAFYFHSVTVDLPEPDAHPAAELSLAARAAQRRIRAQRVPAIESLVKQGLAAGYRPPQLAAAIGLSTDLLGKLEARAIAVATIPRTLVQRLASVLQVAPEAIAAYLRGTAPAQAAAFYYAEQAPAQQQESFLEAVQASKLSPERKQEWMAIIRQEVPDA
jgi:hypothetical protein